MEEIQQIIQSNQRERILPLFLWNSTNTEAEVLFKFNLWVRFFFPKYFLLDDAPFHYEIDQYNFRTYRGIIRSFTDIAFRGAAKSTRTKLFIAFCVANDTEHERRYVKVLTKDLTNSKQYVTDIYNMFVDPKMRVYYPETFAKTDTKREETMQSFTTSTGVKVIGDTVGTDQRGQLQEESRPDWIIFDDFETRKTLRSAVETKAIFDNMEEARTGLSKTGSCIYNCNYVSERGNVHRLVEKEDNMNVVLITPILKDGVPTWVIYTIEQIEQIKKDAEDFEGEYLCRPSKSMDVLFDRETLERMPVLSPVRTVAEFKLYKTYDASHRDRKSVV